MSDKNSEKLFNKIKILIVDDEPLIFFALENTLTSTGYKPTTASNGKDAFNLAKKIKPDLILLDIIMPEEDGFSVLRKLKKDPLTLTIPVIFLTGSTDVESKLHGFSLGAVDYITKPFHPEEVIARINLHLKLSRATELLISSQTEKIKQISEAQCQLLVKPEQLTGGKFSIFYESLQEAGGDYYDVLELSEQIHSYFIADFSGHDIATSFLTPALKAALTQNVSLIYSPAESMKMIHKVLKGILPPEKYLTACLATLNRETNRLTVVSAAHPPLLHIPQDGTTQFIKCQGDAIGIVEDVFYEMSVFEVKPGDKLIFYTDGLLENATEKKTWPSQLSRLLEIAPQLNRTPYQEIPEKIQSLLLPDQEQLADDIVIMAVEV